MEDAKPGIAFNSEVVYDEVAAPAPIPSPPANPSKPKVRKTFKEVAVFQVFSSSGPDTSFTVDIPLGDALTTHVVYASAISPTVGFGTVFDPKELLVFKEVSANLQTPYAMKRFESFNVTITACNYKDVDLMTQLDVFIKGASQEKPGEFENLQEDCTDEVSFLEKQECKVIQCPFRAVKMGNPRMGLELKAKTSEDEEYVVYDQLVKKIKVKPEGCPVERSLTTVELVAGETHVFYLNVSAEDAVANSGIAHVSLYSSLTAPALQNPERLVKQPTGCGEQTMIYLAPLIFLKMILSSAGMSLSVEKDTLLTQYMESGYNRELTYKHPDGSYSAFGPGTDGLTKGSTWLTAFVAKTFAEAKNGDYIYISSDVLLDAYRFMLSTEVIDKDGKVVENGQVYHSEMQGGSSGKDTMSAYHLLSLSQMPADMFANELTSSEKSQFEKLLNAVKSTLDEAAEAQTANNYLLCLGGNAVYDALTTKNEDTDNDVLLNKIRAKVAGSVSSSCGRVYWSNEESTSDSDCECAPEEQLHMFHYSDTAEQKVANKVEITGYCLGFLSKMKNSQDVLVRQQAMSWLGCQQSDIGGFSTTQNTVTGFYGLAMNAEASEATNLQITVEDSLGNSTGPFNMDDSLEVFRYEYLDIPDSFEETDLTDDSSIRVTVSAAEGGQGKIYASGIVYYNTKKCSPAGKDPKLTIEASAKNVQENSMQLQMSMSYSGDEAGNLGMGFFCAEAMSGFAYTPESVAKLEEMDQVQRAEINPDTNNLDIYTVDVQDLTLTVDLHRVEAIAGQQGATVEGGSYYQPMIQSSVLYKSEDLEGGDIFNVCGGNCVTNSAHGLRAVPTSQVGIGLILSVLVGILTYHTM